MEDEYCNGFTDGVDYVLNLMEDCLADSNPETGHGRAQVAFFNRVMWAFDHPAQKKE